MTAYSAVVDEGPAPDPEEQEDLRRSLFAAGFVALVIAGLVAAILLRSCAPATPETVVVAAAGGLVCDPADPDYAKGAGTATACRQRAVSDVVVGEDPDAVLGLGDYQYEEPKAASYAAAYDPTWGRLRARTHPALGNQEYKVHAANTFFTYFGDRAGDETGWSSFDLGRWHVVRLNSNCTQVGGCGPGSPQARWLERDLQDHPNACTVAYWHHPRFSTGLHGSDDRTAELWRLLQAHRADLVLAAHEHDYERFGPLDAAGRPSADGLRSFVVGTGGQAHYAPSETTGEAGTRRAQAARSERRIDDAFGALVLRLGPDGWSWRFLDDRGRTRDRGSARCR